MNTFGIALIVLGGCLICLAHYWFIMNTRYQNYDVMGASINFDQPFFFGTVLIALGIGLRGILAWYWCIGLILVLEVLSLPYKWQILDKVMEVFRRPNPVRKNDSSNQQPEVIASKTRQKPQP